MSYTKLEITRNEDGTMVCYCPTCKAHWKEHPLDGRETIEKGDTIPDHQHGGTYAPPSPKLEITDIRITPDIG